MNEIKGAVDTADTIHSEVYSRTLTITHTHTHAHNSPWTRERNYGEGLREIIGHLTAAMKQAADEETFDPQQRGTAFDSRGLCVERHHRHSHSHQQQQQARLVQAAAELRELSDCLSLRTYAAIGFDPLLITREGFFIIFFFFVGRCCD